MRNKIIILLLEIGFGISFNLVGAISVSEIVLIITAFWYIKRELYTRYKVLRPISYLYIGLLLSQVVSEMLIGNEFSNAIKGFAITIMSYLHFIFLFSFFVKDRKLIIYVIIGFLAKRFIFGSEFEGDVSEVLEGEGATFLKFYLAPVIGNIVLLLSIYVNKKDVAITCLAIGIGFIILGARSGGLSLFLTGLISYMILFLKLKLNKVQIFSIVFFACIFGYGLYYIYAQNILDGKITAGNSQQLKEADNPYNPINLLMVGRTEAFVGWVAFMDKPFFGHGAWANDKTEKYRVLVSDLKKEEYNRAKAAQGIDIIPSHSIIIGAGMQNGILAFIFMLSILIFCLKKGIRSIDRSDPYVLILVSFLISEVWVALFSPNSHFRLTLPLYFAFFLASFIVNEKKKRLTEMLLIIKEKK
jgi:hypothetical protein